MALDAFFFANCWRCYNVGVHFLINWIDARERGVILFGNNYHLCVYIYIQ